MLCFVKDDLISRRVVSVCVRGKYPFTTGTTLYLHNIIKSHKIDKYIILTSHKSFS